MSYEFTEYEPDPQTQASASRSMGPPKKGTGIGVLEPRGENRLPPMPGLFKWPRIGVWLGILLLIASLAALWAMWLLRR